MHPHLSMIIDHTMIFSQMIEKDHEVALRFPGWGTSLFFPMNAKELKGNEVSPVMTSGLLDSGEETHVILDSDAFPLALLVVPKPEDRPRHEFGFAQAGAGNAM